MSWILLCIAWNKRYDPSYLLWFCDIALILIALGLFFRSAILVTAQLTALIVFHLGWNIDFWLYFLFNYFPIGSTAYMFYPDLGLFEKSLSFFNHVFAVPFALYGVYVLGAPKKAWLLQSVQTFIIFLLTYFFTRPEENINWMFGMEISDISPLNIHPILYYSMMIIAPPLIIYLPTNRIVTMLVGRWRSKKQKMINGINEVQVRISPVLSVPFILLTIFISIGISYLADIKCRLEPTVFQIMPQDHRIPLEAMPLSSIKTQVDRVTHNDKNSGEIPLLAWHSPAIPKRWSDSDNRWHVHTKDILRQVDADDIPAVPQEIFIYGRRSVFGSVVWAYIASDKYYLQKQCDLHGYRKTYKIRCNVGGHGLSEYMNPANGEIYDSREYNEILGKGTGAIYAIAVIEVVGKEIVSRSSYYLVKRRGIFSPQDIWFVIKDGVLVPLFSNPADPVHSRFAFQSSYDSSKGVPDIFTCDFLGYEMRNLTQSPDTFDLFVAPNGKPCKGIGWMDPTQLRYCRVKGNKTELCEIIDQD